MATAANTKKVRIELSALTRVEYTEVLEVPADMTDEELDALVDQRYNEIDDSEYFDDPHFWERGDSYGHSAESNDVTTDRIIKRAEDGSFEVVPT